MDGKTGPVISIKVTDALKVLYDDLSQEQKKTVYSSCAFFKSPGSVAKNDETDDDDGPGLF